MGAGCYFLGRIRDAKGSIYEKKNKQRIMLFADVKQWGGSHVSKGARCSPLVAG